MNDLQTLSGRLRTLRHNLSLSQKDVAKAIGSSRQTIESFENGDRMPRSDMLACLCRFYNVSADYLLGFTNEVQIEGCLSDDAHQKLRQWYIRNPMYIDLLEALLDSADESTPLFAALVYSELAHLENSPALSALPQRSDIPKLGEQELAALADVLARADR